VIATVGANVQTFTDTGVLPTTLYTYKVTAVNGTLESGPTPEKQITTGTAPPADPSDLTAVAISSNQVNLNWLDNSSDETGFRIERKTGSGAYLPLQDVPAGSTTFSDTTTVAFTTYTYQVKAFSTTGGSSGPATSQPVTTPVTIIAPTNLDATAFSSTQINLSWTDNSNNEAGFKIERKTGAGSFTEIQTVGIDVHNFSDTGLSASTTYTYKVRAYAGISFSPYSNEDSATTPVSGGPACSTVTTLSGSGAYGYLEGIGTAAQWRKPVGGVVAKYPQNNLNVLFIADTENHRIRMIYLEGASAGQSVWLAGDGTAGYTEGSGLAKNARYNYPRGITAVVNGSGVATKLIIADTNNHVIRQLVWSGSAWTSSLLSGLAGTAGPTDGTPSKSRYNSPQAIVYAPDGFLYVADTSNQAIRKVDQSGNSTTVAGGVGLVTGITTGGGLLYASSLNHRIYQVTTGGAVTSIAGSGVAGFADGTGAAALFNSPAQLVWANPSTGAVLLIADQGNNRIRKLVISTNAVVTHAGSGVAGFLDTNCGAAQFNAPRGIAYLSTGEVVYAIDTNNNRIRKLQ
jgi:hypothetical protein